MLPWAKKHFWTTMDVGIFKPNNHFKAIDNRQNL